MGARKPRGPTFWAAVGLAPVVAVTALVELRTFYGAIATGDTHPVFTLVTGLVFLVWNCSPTLLALALVFASRESSPMMRFAAYGFAVGEAGPVLYGHVVWAFDIGRAATGSSTSALLFLFLPAAAIKWGVISAVPGGVIGFAWGPRGAAPPSRPDVR